MTAAPVADDIKTEGRHRIGYLPYLDGLRGVAILMVLIFHAGGGWMKGGFIGVDIFFVLSGYLITLLLIKEWDKQGHIHLGHFYMRRALRLLPAVVVLLLVYIPTGFGTSVNPITQRLKDAGIVFFYIANWVRAFGGYLSFELGHTWSLAIEEQFYFLWPALFLLLMKSRLSRRAIVWVIVAGAVAVAVWRGVLFEGLGVRAGRVYNGLDTHSDGLLMGCALAYFVGAYQETIERYRDRLRVAGIWAGLFVLVVAFTMKVDYRIMVTGFFFLVAVAAAVVVLGMQSHDGPLRQAMQWPPLVKLGRISYGVYLWHWPIYHVIGQWGRHHDIAGRRLYVLFGGAAVSILIAWLSYRFIESKFLKLKSRFQ